MEHYSVLYLPVGVATFDMQYAQQLFEESRTMLLELYKDVICPPEILLSPKALSVFLQDKRPNLIICKMLPLQMPHMLRRLSAIRMCRWFCGRFANRYPAADGCA